MIQLQFSNRVWPVIIQDFGFVPVVWGLKGLNSELRSRTGVSANLASFNRRRFSLFFKYSETVKTRAK